MKKVVLLFLFFVSSVSFAQDAPSDGDIVFTQVGSDSPDVIEFITLKRLNLTTLKITDNGILSDGTIRSGEGTFDLSNTSWTDVDGGTFVRLGSDVANDNDDSDRILAYDGTGSGTLPNLTEANDQCIAYTGSASSPTFIAGINFGSTDWNAGATSTSDSKAPGTLSDCDLATLDNQYFSSTVNGDAATTRSAIINPVNWSGQSSSALGYQDLTGSINSGALPVELTSFSATENSGDVSLNWETATEVDNYGFEVERKTENGHWSLVGFVPGHGNSNSPKQYEYVDENIPAEKLTYRLKQIDTDGGYEYYSLTAKVDASSLTSVDGEVEITEYKLEQNYPNPFNPSTVISYQLYANSSVELKVFDLLGREVALLVKKEQVAGKHSVKFNAGNLPSGVYMYKLITNTGFVDSKKFVLMK